MFKKILFTAIAILGLSTTPQQAKASIPIGEIIEGAKAAKEVYDVAQPLLVRCGKAIKRVCKKIVKFVRRHRHGNQDNVYVNPARTAALEAAEEELQEAQRRAQRSHIIDADFESSPF